MGDVGIADVVDAHAGTGLAVLAGLVCHQHGVADDGQGVGAEVVIVQVGLGHHLRVSEVAHVHAGEVLGGALVGHVEDAPAAGRLVQVHSLADVVVPFEIDVGNEPHVFDFLGSG